jgi:hypothetical protein
MASPSANPYANQAVSHQMPNNPNPYAPQNQHATMPSVYHPAPSSSHQSMPPPAVVTTGPPPMMPVNMAPMMVQGAPVPGPESRVVVLAPGTLPIWNGSKFEFPGLLVSYPPLDIWRLAFPDPTVFDLYEQFPLRGFTRPMVSEKLLLSREEFAVNPKRSAAVTCTGGYGLTSKGHAVPFEPNPARIRTKALNKVTKMVTETLLDAADGQLDGEINLVDVELGADLSLDMDFGGLELDLDLDIDLNMDFDMDFDMDLDFDMGFDFGGFDAGGFDFSM